MASRRRKKKKSYPGDTGSPRVVTFYCGTEQAKAIHDAMKAVIEQPNYYKKNENSTP